MLRHTPIEERFWKHVYKTSGCWFWIGGLNGHGRNTYGTFRTDPKTIEKSHRVSWMLHFGDIPAGKQVLHTCDTPQCVRPDHLFLGDNSINQRDAWIKGRRHTPDNRGESHGLSKLTVAEVKEIRRLFVPRKRGCVLALAKKFNVTTPTIYSVISRARWGHIA